MKRIVGVKMINRQCIWPHAGVIVCSNSLYLPNWPIAPALEVPTAKSSSGS